MELFVHKLWFNSLWIVFYFLFFIMICVVALHLEDQCEVSLFIKNSSLLLLYILFAYFSNTNFSVSIFLFSILSSKRSLRSLHCVKRICRHYWNGLLTLNTKLQSWWTKGAYWWVEKSNQFIEGNLLKFGSLNMITKMKYLL